MSFKQFNGGPRSNQTTILPLILLLLACEINRPRKLPYHRFGLFALDILIFYMHVACYTFVCFFMLINIKTIYHFLLFQIPVASWQFISKTCHCIHVTMSNTHPTTRPKTWDSCLGLTAAFSIPSCTSSGRISSLMLLRPFSEIRLEHSCTSQRALGSHFLGSYDHISLTRY